MKTKAIKPIENLFLYYKGLGEKAMDQVSDEALFHAPDDKSNSISVIVKHLHGNMLSRWTDFLTTDGEKEWRERDDEFEDTMKSREELMQRWEEGWKCLFDALHPLTDEDLKKVVYIRHMGQPAEEAILRQLAHYAYHVGQIVYLSRMLNEGDWMSLSIPKKQSKQFNQERFEKEKRLKDFTEDK